ncbi:DUF4241 domain-containing protein [Nocardia sp. BSTN01]|uniref:DUF4241 domain-containing protein n=1 Tax=Nocardia sp. BSTN01 TaxID=2783665 RepID=UPI00188F3D8D|nr:DUF4241 domain-containing protein [Nocardia sp. BSTN01]MBF5002197.1 DUF4241 domain-containing protein [Nocardia sp. BSTN01]
MHKYQEAWTWQVHLFDERSFQTHRVHLTTYSTGLLRIDAIVRRQCSSEQQYFARAWDRLEVSEISVDGLIETRTWLNGSDLARPSPDAPAELSSAPIDDLLIPAPDFGDWHVFLRFLIEFGHEPAATVTFNEPGVELPQGPLRAGEIEQLFTTGPRVTPEGPAVVELIGAGKVHVPSGQLAVMDPLTFDEPEEAWQRITMPPGVYPVTVAVWRFADVYRGSVTAAVRVSVLDTPVSVWQMCVRPDQDPAMLGDGEFHGVDSDTGMMAFFDAARPMIENEFGDDELLERVYEDIVAEQPSTETQSNLIAVRTDRPDGVYPVWIGRTDDGQVSCVVLDFQLYPPLTTNLTATW